MVGWYDCWLVEWRVVLLFRAVYNKLLLLSFMSEAELSLTARLPRESSFCLQNQPYLPRNVFILQHLGLVWCGFRLVCPIKPLPFEQFLAIFVKLLFVFVLSQQVNESYLVNLNKVLQAVSFSWD